MLSFPLCTRWDCCAPVVTWRTLRRSCLRLGPVCLNTRCQSADCICRCRWSYFNDLSLTAAGNDSSGIQRELNSSPSVLKKPSEERSVLFKISPRLLSPMKINRERDRSEKKEVTEMRKRDREGQWEREILTLTWERLKMQEEWQKRCIFSCLPVLCKSVLQ